MIIGNPRNHLKQRSQTCAELRFIAGLSRLGRNPLSEAFRASWKVLPAATTHRLLGHVVRVEWVTLGPAVF